MDLTTSAGRQMSLGETLTGAGGGAAMASGTVFQTGWERKEDIPLLVTHFLEKSVCIFFHSAKLFLFLSDIAIGLSNLNFS